MYDFGLNSDLHNLNANLMWCSSWDKNSISQKLNNGPALDSIVLVQSATQRLVQIPALVVNRVVVWWVLLTLLLPNLHWWVKTFLILNSVVIHESIEDLFSHFS